jgi:hypothetical protein
MPIVFDEVEATVEDQPAPTPGQSEDEGGDARPPADEEHRYLSRRRQQRESRVRAD